MIIFECHNCAGKLYFKKDSIRSWKRFHEMSCPYCGEAFGVSEKHLLSSPEEFERFEDINEWLPIT